MRRTLALVGAAVLTLGLSGLAGPASADTGIAQQETDTLLGEIAANLVTSNFKGSYIELANPSQTVSVPLQGYEVRACSATGPLEMVFSAFDSTHIVPAGGSFLIADRAFAAFGGDADIVVEDLGLEQSHGGVRLSDTTASPVLHDSVNWGTPTDSVCAAFAPAGVSPDDVESINRDIPTDTWFRDDPTPAPSV